MAKQPDNTDPQRKHDAHEEIPIEYVDDVEEVLDAEEVEPSSQPIEETKTARPSPPPTRIAPYQADAGDADEALDVHHVFAGDHGQGPASSSIIEVAELAEIVDEGTPRAVAEPIDDTVDLGSDPGVYVDPSKPPENKNVKSQPKADETAHATEEINWDDIIEDEGAFAAPPGEKEDALGPAETPGMGEEGGSNTGAAKQDVAKHEVTFDDVDAENEEPASKSDRKSLDKNKHEAGIYDEEGLAASDLKQGISDVEFDEGEPVSATEKADAADERADAADDLAAHAMLVDFEAAAAAKSVEGALMDGAHADEPDKNPEAHAEPVAQKKERKQNGADDEKAALAGPSKRASRLGSGRGVLVGTCLATLILAGGAAAVWYAKPDLLEGVSKSSPNYAPPKQVKAKVAPLAVPLAAQARAHMDSNEFDKALSILKDADKTPVNLSTRAEARWLKYLQENGAEKPLDKNAPEVKLVLADLEQAGNDLLKTQVTRVLSGGGKSNEKEIHDLQEKLTQAEDTKKETEKHLVELRDALAKEKLLDGQGKLGPAAFSKAVKELADSKASLAAVNKLLEDAKVQDAGAKGVAGLLTAKKEAEEKLEAIDKALADTKFKGEGVKALTEMIADQGKLVKQRDELEQTVKAAYQELSAGGLMPASDDPRSQIVEAAKIVRQKAESAANSLKDLSDPAAYFLPRAERLAAQGNLKEALEALNLGLKARPDNPRLLALRAQVRLEGAYGNRKRIEAVQKEIRQDAEKAARDPAIAAESAYIQGLLDESLGDYDRAEKDYRRAIAAHRGNSDDASRYIIALARLLQRERAAGAPRGVPADEVAPEPQKENEDKVQPPQKAAPKSEQARLETVRDLVAVSLVAAQAVQAGNDKASPPSTRLQESIGLANRLIQSANPKIKGQGYMILGQAMFKNGRHMEGLQEYVKGLGLLYPGDLNREMLKLLTTPPAIPAVPPPEVESPRSNPALAEQLFGNGLELFWSGRYPEAEMRFKEAIQHSQDARFDYYLGMALMAQPSSSKQRAAYYAFEQGARLEAVNRPSMGEVNASLERIQGSLRSYVNSFRQRARTMQ